MSQVKVKAIRITIHVTDEDGDTKEHCTIEHMPGANGHHQTGMMYPNVSTDEGAQREAEEWTRSVLRAALHSVDASLAGDSAVSRRQVPKSVH